MSCTDYLGSGHHHCRIVIEERLVHIYLMAELSRYSLIISEPRDDVVRCEAKKKKDIY